MGIKFPIAKNLKDVTFEKGPIGEEKKEGFTIFGRTIKVSLDFNAMFAKVCFRAK